MSKGTNLNKKVMSKEEEADVGDSTLSMYMVDINKVALMTREEEDETARQAADGNRAALNRLVNANLRFVVNIARKYQGLGLPLLDLISEGNLGLLSAAERFDADKGYHFISYAVWWIRQSILKAVCEKSRMIRLPVNKAGQLVRIEKELRSTAGEKTLGEGLDNVSSQLNLDARKVADLFSVTREVISLDLPSSGEDDAGSLGDQLEDSSYESPAEFAMNSVIRDDINNVLDTLDLREAAVIRYRFGLENGHRM